MKVKYLNAYCILLFSKENWDQCKKASESWLYQSPSKTLNFPSSNILGADYVEVSL